VTQTKRPPANPGRFNYGSYLLFGLLEAERYLFSKVELSGHGTGKIPSDAIEGLWFVDPTCQQVQAVLPLLDSLNERIAVNNKECHALAATRELLLPKLISGEVRIVNADKITGDAR
jgi:type I restriction enzyme S subunit